MTLAPSSPFAGHLREEVVVAGGGSHARFYPLSLSIRVSPSTPTYYHTQNGGLESCRQVHGKRLARMAGRAVYLLVGR